jgi:hypothetical protein
MKGLHRNTVDRSSSLLAMTRVFLAYFFVNEISFLYTYAIMLMVEFVLLTYLIHDKISVIFRFYPMLMNKLKLNFNSSYLLANIGYITGFNIDRIVSFQVLDSSSYKELIITTSLLSMSILPNKLIENIKIFPPRSRHESVLHKSVSYIFPLLGIVAFIGGIWIFNAQLDIATKIYLSIISVIWVPMTLYYNNIWAIHLRDGGNIRIAKMTLWAGLISAALSIMLSHLYVFIVPLGLYFYCFLNATFVYFFHNRT